MSDAQNREDARPGDYDAMTTEQLRQLLREDASKPESEKTDTEALRAVMEALAKRKKEGKTPGEALESFKQNYLAEKNAKNTDAGRKRRGVKRWIQGAAAAAAVLALMVGGSLTAKAMGVDVWKAVAKLTQETFYFGRPGQLGEKNAPTCDYSGPCVSFWEVLSKGEITVEIVPGWLPEGYQEKNVEVIDMPTGRAYCGNYENGEKIIFIRVSQYKGNNPFQIERDNVLPEVYTRDGIDYYIFPNYDMMEAAWIIDSYECCISGPVSTDEMKQIIDSIGKG